MFKENIYAASDFLEKVKTENSGLTKGSSLLFNNLKINKDVDNPNRCCLVYWHIYDPVICIPYAAILCLILVASFIINMYNPDITIALLLPCGILVIISVLIFSFLQKRYCYIDENNVIISRHAEKQPTPSGKVILSLPTQSCEIGFSRNICMLWTMFLKSNGKEHVLSYNLIDARPLFSMMEKKP